MILTCYDMAGIAEKERRPIGNHGSRTTSLKEGWRLPGALWTSSFPDAIKHKPPRVPETTAEAFWTRERLLGEPVGWIRKL